MLDVERLLGELERILLNVSKLAAEGGGREVETKHYSLGGDVRVSTSFKVGFLDETLAAQAPGLAFEREPMIDVMQTNEGFKVLVLMPGVGSKDVKVFAGQRSLVFEVNARGRSYRREIPCDAQPTKIAIKSIVENNSVVEIAFARKEAADK